MDRLRGAYTALVTPMKEGLEIDYDGLERLTRAQIDAGVDGVVALGTTGEAPTIEEDEAEEVIRRVVKVAKGRVRVIVGASSNSTAHAVASAKRAEALGADLLLVVTPYYNKPTNEGIYRHFKAVADATSIGIVAYNIFSRTSKNIDVPTMKRLALIPSVVAVKESSGDLAQMMDVIAVTRALRPDFAVLSGDDALALPLMSLGGDGLISTIGNLCPAKVAELVRAALDGDFAKAREAHYWLLPLIKAAFQETNPIPVKAMLGMVGLPSGPLRLPLCEAQAETLERARAAMKEAGLL
jgi:4-hydroxy-tetrahydrodipicolinate synthase